MCIRKLLWPNCCLIHSASSASVVLPTNMYTSDLIETNVDAVNGAGGHGEMYAEIDQMQRMMDNASATHIMEQPQDYLAAVDSK